MRVARSPMKSFLLFLCAVVCVSASGQTQPPAPSPQELPSAPSATLAKPKPAPQQTPAQPAPQTATPAPQPGAQESKPSTETTATPGGSERVTKPAEQPASAANSAKDENPDAVTTIVRRVNEVPVIFTVTDKH